MTVDHAPGEGPDLGLDPTPFGLRDFNSWLKIQLKARRLSQRQLAQRSGVDHSTISRLMRGNRVPSLHTATMLVHGLGIAEGLGGLDDQNLGRSASPAARVEYALRSDDLLQETAVLEIMKVYLAARVRSPGMAAKSDHEDPTRSTPVPIVVGVSDPHARSTTPEELPAAARGRLSRSTGA
ncbi:MAG: helix-turn-helix transcriptional regulator [Chloroflexota bacterium]